MSVELFWCVGVFEWIGGQVFGDRFRCERIFSLVALGPFASLVTSGVCRDRVWCVLRVGSVRRHFPVSLRVPWVCARGWG